jgi:glycosyltransferase involved in cell wall biosynthesis
VIKVHVLMVSNHWEAQAHSPWAGIFVDRQIASLEKAGVRISRFDIGKSHSPMHIAAKCIELRKVVKRLQPDLVHAQYGTIVSFVSALAGPPLIISFCGSDLLEGASVSVIRAHLGFLLSNLAALGARRLICKSEQLKRALWWRRDRAVVIPNGIDFDLFSPGSREVARRYLGLDQGSQVVLFNAGTQPRLKGLDVAQEAIKKVRTRLPNAQLCVISNVQPEVMPEYYRAADVLLSASLREGSPNVVKEALACNLPVVSTPVGDVEERLAGVRPSAVVPRDAEAIGTALIDVLLKQERSNGREKVAFLKLENVAQRILNVYLSVLQR